MKVFLQYSALIFVFLFLLSACEQDETILELNEYDWELVEINDFNDEVFHPKSMWFDHNDHLIIHDMGDQVSPVKILRDGRVTNSIPVGRGPGEVEYILSKHFSESKRSRYIFDPAQSRMLKFDEKYTFIGDVVDSRINDGVYISAIYSDSLAFTISRDHILQIFDLNTSIEDQKTLFTLHDNDYDFLDPLRNYFLRQSFSYDSDAQDLYLAMKHSSLIMHIDSEYNFNHTFGPDSIGIAKNEDYEFYALPRLGHQREGLRDMRVHGDYLFAILNGSTYGRKIQIQYSRDFDSLIDKVNHGEILLVFNRHTLEFIQAIKLPLPAAQLMVSDEHIFLLNYIDDYPSIYIYKNHIN